MFRGVAAAVRDRGEGHEDSTEARALDPHPLLDLPPALTGGLGGFEASHAPSREVRSGLGRDGDGRAHRPHRTKLFTGPYPGLEVNGHPLVAGENRSWTSDYCAEDCSLISAGEDDR